MILFLRYCWFEFVDRKNGAIDHPQVFDRMQGEIRGALENNSQAQLVSKRTARIRSTIQVEQLYDDVCNQQR